MGVSQQYGNRNKWWATAIGIGLALSPIHNLWITNLATNSKGETVFFLPAFGYLILIMGTGLFLLNNWDRVRGAGLGSKAVVAPLAVIVAAMALSGITADGWQNKVSPLGMGLFLFAAYMASRVLGKDVFLPLAVGAAIASVGVVAYSLVHIDPLTKTAVFDPAVVHGGYVFENNYDILAGYVLLGTALCIRRWQWSLAALSLLAMFLSGSPEGVFAVAVLGLLVLIRRDWGKRLATAVVPVLVVAAVSFAAGYGQQQYSYLYQILGNEPIIEESTGQPLPNHPVRQGKQPAGEAEQSGLGLSPMGYRLHVIGESLSGITPLGEGYNLTDFSKSPNVHNVPLVLVQQLGYPGILAAAAWLWVSLYCIIRTRWKYAWASILVLSVFDHYVWTQLAPVWWMVAGASTTSSISSDLVFRDTEICAE